jgi:hypothetical protein
MTASHLIWNVVGDSHKDDDVPAVHTALLLQGALCAMDTGSIRVFFRDRTVSSHQWFVHVFIRELNTLRTCVHALILSVSNV